MNISEYLNETLREKFNPEKAKSSIDIEKALNNGDFEITNAMLFNLKNLDNNELEKVEDAIRKYWDDGGIDWLRIERDGTKFDIVETKTREQKSAEDQEEEQKDDDGIDKLIDSLSVFDEEDDGEDDEDEEEWDDEDDELIFGEEEPEESEEGEESEEDLKESIDILEKGYSSGGGDSDDPGLAKRAWLSHRRRKKIRRIKKQMAYLQHKIDTAESSAERRKLETNLDFIKQSSFDENGKAIFSKRKQRKRVEQLIKNRRFDPSEIMSREQMKEMRKTAKEYWKDPKNKEDKRKYIKDTKKSIKRYIHDNNPDLYKRLERQDKRQLRSTARKALKGKLKDEDSEEEKNNPKDKSTDEEGFQTKEETIKDEKGKNIKVTTHTGPRGGKFYYPKGAPKDEEHRVYLDKDNRAKVKESSHIPMPEYIRSVLE